MNQRTYLMYVSLLAVIAATYIIGPVVAENHASVRLISWDLFLLWLLGFFALALQGKAGFYEPVDRAVKPVNRIGIPITIGILFGIADVLVFEVFLKHPKYTELPPFLQPFPYSLLLFTSGAAYVEILHRLLPLTAIMLLVHRYLPAKYHNVLFWISAVLTSVWEPLEQMPSGTWGLIAYSLLSGFVFNLLQAVFFRKAGWLAALLIRLGHYLIWHILLGIYIQYAVL